MIDQTRDAEVQLAEQIGRFYADPLGYMLFAFPWGEKGTPLERHAEGPDQWARDLCASISEQVLDNMERRRRGDPMMPVQIARASGHGIGKSATVAKLIHWLMSTRRDCRGIVTANTENQLATKTWPELSKWHALAINGHWFNWTATRFSFALYDENRQKNYCFDAVPWSEHRTESFAGLHNENSAVCFIFDEASAIPDKIWEVASGGLTDGEPFWFAFGNPTRNSGRFFQCFHKDRKYWNGANIDSRSVRITNKEYLNRLVEQYGPDSYEARVRVMGQFPRESATQFISTASVQEAVARPVEKEPLAPLLLGVDVARQGDDKTVLYYRRGPDARSIKPQVFSKLDTMETAARVMESVMGWNPDYIFVDGVGVGGGVVDRLRQLGLKVVEVNAGSRADDPRRYVNKRAEMWGRMKEWIENRGCVIDDQILFTDLTAPEYRYSNAQQIQLERKEEMKRRGLDSPDMADALALTFSTRVAHRLLKTGRNRTPGVRVAKGVDSALF